MSFMVKMQKTLLEKTKKVKATQFNYTFSYRNLKTRRKKTNVYCSDVF